MKGTLSSAYGRYTHICICRCVSLCVYVCVCISYMNIIILYLGAYQMLTLLLEFSLQSLGFSGSHYHSHIISKIEVAISLPMFISIILFSYLMVFF